MASGSVVMVGGAAARSVRRPELASERPEPQDRVSISDNVLGCQRDRHTQDAVRSQFRVLSDNASIAGNELFEPAAVLAMLHSVSDVLEFDEVGVPERVDEFVRRCVAVKP